MLEKRPIYFKSDVSAAVFAVDAKSPYSFNRCVGFVLNMSKKWQRNLHSLFTMKDLSRFLLTSHDYLRLPRLPITNTRQLEILVTTLLPLLNSVFSPIQQARYIDVTISEFQKGLENFSARVMFLVPFYGDGDC